jgi:hypothetical protein
MSTTATLVFKAFLGGATAAKVAALIAAVPVPSSVLGFLGLRVISDTTPVASPVIRTIVLGLNPASTATATATRKTQNSASPIGSLAVTSAGSGYVVPPIVSFTGGRPAPVVRPGFPTIVVTENVAPDSNNNPAVAAAYLKVVGAAVAAGGAGYSANTFATVAPSPTGDTAVLTLTVIAGVITAVTIVDPGSGYTSIPFVSIVDMTGPGVGGAITLSMGVGGLTLLREGSGYVAAPTVVLTPAFQAMFPVAGDQSTPLEQLMTTALSEAVNSPVTAMPVVIA